MTEILSEFQAALLSIDVIKARRLLAEATTNTTAEQLVETVIVSALENIGKGWEAGHYALAQVYMSGRICEELVDTLLPKEDRKKNIATKMAITTLNDYHALGKRIVYSALRACGFDLLDYGRLGVEGLVKKIMDDGLDVILISVLMFPSALHVKDIREQLDKNGYTVKIVVGGAPFRLDPHLWRQVGADAVGYTASDAIKIVQSIYGEIA
ncbi:MAG: cobalamin-dependent protein [Proteobacteria bacterium]|nr:cobalamin-dependent protein [Pseudomonadota bacterium]